MKDKLKFEISLFEANNRYSGSVELAAMMIKYKGIFKDCEHLKSKEGTKTDNEGKECDSNKQSQYNDWTQFFAQHADEILDSVPKKHERSVVTKLEMTDTTIPSFSLGLTQEFASQEGEIKNCRETDVFGFTPLRVIPNTTFSPIKNDVVFDRRNPKRLRKAAYACRSPYLIRPIDMHRTISVGEGRIWKYLLDGYRSGMSEGKKSEMEVKEGVTSMVGDENTIAQEQKEVANEFRDDIFETSSGVGTKRFLLISLTPGKRLESSVLDCWASVLNYEEEKKKSQESLHRLFCHTCVITHGMLTDKNLTDADRLNMFGTNMFVVVDKNKALMNLKIYELVLFPIIEGNHYYLICFDLKNPSIVVVDNIHESLSPVGVKDASEFHDKDTPLKVVRYMIYCF
ncbi:putative papain-like cysteine peptidase superfamily [Helianthus annuus]|nr:putative papain-like cysteine peptidase superfamily [Helianthus annuus]KAJ0470218.1 putative papain-like cysteine peptidase superfamily [Helianthus annuus]KAJ0487000.1 putative papain-like cysteine peptidase superfamily [Helianthus annuus]KAJ0661119.1 putative papain-like cysteine peptidase superfamily [Helianthus annuus]KAJ0841697.1 putative papain-like cysteine peptidase superfamily [Helianthus annuus]